MPYKRRPGSKLQARSDSSRSQLRDFKTPQRSELPSPWKLKEQLARSSFLEKVPTTTAQKIVDNTPTSEITFSIASSENDEPRHSGLRIQRQQRMAQEP